MAERQVKTTQFLSGQQSNAAKTGPTRTTLKSNVSKMRNAGGSDPLSQALKGRDSYIPSEMHKFSHNKTSASGGAHYTPAGEFGKPHGKLGSKATDYPSHTSRKGENAVGRPDGGRGGNPLGNNSGRKGSNPLGHYLNKRGENPLGNHGNRVGQKSGYPSFSPRGGGKEL